MVTVFDLPAQIYIQELARYLQENVDTVTPPAWATYVKTGAHTQRQPSDNNWWYVRCASLLRKLYVHESFGTARLKKEYGGRRRRMGRPAKSMAGGGSIIRKALQQLESSGLVKTIPKRGRIVSNEGRSLMDKIASKLSSSITGSSGPKG